MRESKEKIENKKQQKIKKSNITFVKTITLTSGITLIALVITIVVLLILAGVSIAMLTGNNGILTQAQNAKNKAEQSEEIEKIKLAVTEAQIGNDEYKEIGQGKLQQSINERFEGKKAIVTKEKEGIFTVNLDNKIYEIKNGEVNEIQADLYINNSKELKTFRDEVNNGNTYKGKYIVLTNNIELDTNEEWEAIGVYQQDSTSPDDESNIAFEGIFDGCFHTISGINTNSSLKNRGLFGFIKQATIKNLGVVNGNIKGTARTGAIVGYAYDSSKIINCYNLCNITSTDNYVGGIAGFINKGTIIESCYNNGSVNSAMMTGGIVGGIGNSTIKNSYSSAIIKGGYVGGISGQIIGTGVIENCYNAGNLISKNVLSINYSGNDKTKVTFKNNYYLENTVNGANDIYIIEQNKVKNEQEMKNLYSSLGEMYKEDINNINNGYPILYWQ